MKDKIMNFGKWFEKQHMLIQIILMLIPLVNWIVELLIRWPAFLKKDSVPNLVMAILHTFFGAFYILEILDIVWVILKKQLFLVEK